MQVRCIISGIIGKFQVNQHQRVVFKEFSDRYRSILHTISEKIFQHFDVIKIKKLSWKQREREHLIKLEGLSSDSPPPLSRLTLLEFAIEDSNVFDSFDLIDFHFRSYHSKYRINNTAKLSIWGIRTFIKEQTLA